MRSFTTVCDTLIDDGKKVQRKKPGHAVAQCPAHDDGRPSLSITWADGKTLLKCFAGCTTGAIVDALNLHLSDLWDEQTAFTGIDSMTGYQLLVQQMPAIIEPAAPPADQQPVEYLYTDIDGDPIGRKLRYIGDDGKKTFRQQRYDNGQWVPGLAGIDLPLYNLPLIDAAHNAGETVWIVEGEKDADTMLKLGEIATTMPNGAGSWRDTYTAQLAGITRINIIADNDEPGLNHATAVKDSLEAAGIDVTLFLPADGFKDITDMVTAGRTLTDLVDPEQRITELQAEQRDKQLRKLIDEEILKQTARDTAKKHISDTNAAARYALPDYAPTLTDELAKPDEEIRYIIDELWPVGANISLTATYKAGKTSTINNIVKALADGLPLFGYFQTSHQGRIAIWNYEVSANQIRRWIREVNIRNTDNISLLNMRGHTWPVTSDYVIEHTIAWLRDNNITTWIIDPLARAFVGSGDENSNQDVGIFLDTLDYIKDQAGVSNLLIAAHTGRNAEQGNNRARGASRFDDWVDARWMLTKDTDNQRWFTADGRDVTIDESKLDYDETTRRQTIHIGMGKKAITQGTVNDSILAVLSQYPDGLSKNKLIEKVVEKYDEAFGLSKAYDKTALRIMVDLGLITKDGNGIFRTAHHFKTLGDD